MKTEPELFKKVFITDSTCFGLFDKCGNLRAVSNSIDGVFQAKIKWGWKDKCSIRKIRLTRNGIKFGQTIS